MECIMPFDYNKKLKKEKIVATKEHNFCPLCNTPNTMKRVIVRELKDTNKTQIMGYMCETHNICIPDF